ncbi:threonine ammonia-lyase [Cavenderia fasciculata]|uniref:Threonine ammonia-lyase n=1 Tax=Cavenderia fasciculata TaxID=261658 RepID=F4Q8I7_CACFS|nr:threonine ammonia-lyase [Cavenderia fasciculata]EGG16087.1 threonine ammonia-lyase [Cavenderia fasciculata]|eukprot:XP_004352412.1 threonine ammonia-lyase [Cavenderia fasciculata]
MTKKHSRNSSKDNNNNNGTRSNGDEVMVDESSSSSTSSDVQQQQEIKKTKYHNNDINDNNNNNTTTTTTTNNNNNNHNSMINDMNNRLSFENATPIDQMNNPIDILRGFDDIGNGVIRDKDGKVDFIESVNRVSSYVSTYLKKTPQLHYELLSQLFKCNVQLKLENLQLFGDVYVRNCFSVLIGNYFNQVSTIKKELREVGGYVSVMDPDKFDLQATFAGIVLTAIHLKMKFIIYVAPGKLNILQVVQLYMCHARGAKIIFHKGDTQTCYQRAKQHANDLHMVFVDMKFNPQFSLIGAGTLASEMMEDCNDRDAIIIPLRMYSVGWSYVSAISLFYKIKQPKMKTIVVQMIEDLKGLSNSLFAFQQTIEIEESNQKNDQDLNYNVNSNCTTPFYSPPLSPSSSSSSSSNLNNYNNNNNINNNSVDIEGKEYNRQSLFPDRAEIGWLALINDQSDLTNVFDSFDSRNQGKFTVEDVKTMLTSMGADISRNSPICAKSSYSQTEFVGEVITLHFASLSGGEKIFQPFLEQLSLDNLLSKKIIDQLVPVTEDQAAIAFIKCLEYTHTLTNGKGSIALGGLLSGNIKLKEDAKIVLLISGGFVDVIDFQTILNYGLDMIGQSFEITLDLPDNTTALTKVLQVIGSNNSSIHEVNMDRSCETLKQYHVRTTIQCHSRNFEQQKAVFDNLTLQGFKYTRSPAPYSTQSELSIISPPLPPPITPINYNDRPPMVNINIDRPLLMASTGVPQSYKRSIQDITVKSIREAQQRIKHIMSPTPIYHSTTYSKLCGCKVTLMLENIQKTGSFKIRGSSNMVLRAIEQSEEKPVGLVAASAGNHAQGVALISSKVGLPCTIVCPEYAPDSKLSNTTQYGAEVIKKGKSLEEAVKLAESICKERAWTLVRPYNDVDVIEGQGTMGCDIYDKVPDVDTVLVNVGGGGMIAGIALFLKRINPNIRIIGVQSVNVSTLADFKQTNQLRYIEPAVLSLADGTNVKMPGGVHTQVLHDLVDEYVTVSENEIASTIVHLMYNSRTVSEGAGCLGLAALLHHKIQVRKDERVVVIICGGNIDMSTLRQVYEYGLRSLGRSFTIHLTTWDYPGNLHKIISLAARAELKVREIRHIRGTGDINWNEVTISLSFYSNSFHHQNFFLSLLVEEGLFPKVIGRKYIKDHDTVYQIFDRSGEQKQKQLQETFKERQIAFLETYGKQANTSTLL